MPPDSSTSENHSRRFVERVRESGEVWGLRGEEGWAYCTSSEYEDTDVLIFWSDRAAAQPHAQGEWARHRPTAIPLEEFIEQWLEGMHEDGALVGLNWDADLNGPEIEPSDLAEELTADESHETE